MDSHVNAWQEVITKLVFHDQLVNPKRIAWRLHKHSDYLSDICRRERIDPFAVANEILKEAEQFAGDDPQKVMQICGPIFGLLLTGTRWCLNYVDPPLAHGMAYNHLCEQAGLLCEDMGGAIKSLARVEADGRYTAEDDPNIDECQTKIVQLISRLQVLSIQLRERRAASVKGNEQ